MSSASRVHREGCKSQETKEQELEKLCLEMNVALFQELQILKELFVAELR